MSKDRLHLRQANVITTMAKPIRLTPRKDGTSWRLSVPAKLSITGKRQNLFYRTQALALAAAADLKKKREEFGTQALAISPVLADQAVAADKLLKPWGITILDAAQRIAEMEAATAASASMESAFAAFQLAKDGKSDKQKAAIKHMGKHLCEDFAGRQISTITREEVAKHLEARTSGPHAFNGKLRLYVTFWRWAAKPPREWCKADALSHIDRKETVPSKIGVLTSKEAAKLMATAEKYFPDTVIPFAVALFTGMRQAEVERLKPEDFTKDGINVPAENDRKNNRRRFIDTPAPLEAWLKKYPIKGNVVPPNWSRKYDAVRRLAGWSVWSDLVPTLDIDPKLEPEAPEDAPAWPNNALRHTAATVALQTGKTLQDLIFEHGHTEGEDMLKRHYIGVMSKAEALKIWSIRPDGTKAVKLKLVEGAA